MTIILYDIIYTDDPINSTFYASPNPWKVRLSLLHKKRKGSKATGPSIELVDGTILSDSFHLPDAPSLFTGSLSNSRELARNGVWFDIIFPSLQRLTPPGPNWTHSFSDAMLAPTGYEAHLTRPEREDLMTVLNSTWIQMFLQGSMTWKLCARDVRELWEDQGMEEWVARMLERYPEVKPFLRELK
ncbi:hypothetical protein BC829DRAFT_390936 [Chytridium lagenaria]|nr:hypothetical protein BC829DRAFT_390936 [Chytridium lagenaria]